MITVHVGTRNVTNELQVCTFRKEAIGGVVAIGVSLARPLARMDSEALKAYEWMHVCEAKTGRRIASAKLGELGRKADPGQVWNLVGYGPVAHADDVAKPIIYIDESVTDGWREVDKTHAGGTTEFGANKPGAGLDDEAPDAIFFQFPQGEVIATNDRRTARYYRIQDADQKIATIACTADCGQTAANALSEIVTRTDGNTGEVANSATMSTTAATRTAIVVTDFPNGRNTVDVRAMFTGAGATVANDNWWAAFYNMHIRAMIVDKSGTEITSYSQTLYVTSAEVVADVVGRLLPLFDGTVAQIGASSYQITQMAYPDPVSARTVLEDVMGLEPNYRWYSYPPPVGFNKYLFTWASYPGQVRYEASLEDGGEFPSSTQEVYNAVSVRYRNAKGRTRTVTRTLTSAVLANAGMTRTAHIDLSGEIGTASAAAVYGDAFLAAHNVPTNVGTLTVARRIFDHVQGRLIEPYEIEAGELIRVRGVESFPDSLNVSASDGTTVFRIWSVDYTSEGNRSTLELDAHTRNVANALASLIRRRKRV